MLIKNILPGSKFTCAYATVSRWPRYLLRSLHNLNNSADMLVSSPSSIKMRQSALAEKFLGLVLKPMQLIRA